MITLIERNALIVPDLSIDTAGSWIHLPTVNHINVLVSNDLTASGSGTNGFSLDGTNDPSKTDFLVLTGAANPESSTGPHTVAIEVSTVLPEWVRLRYTHNATDLAAGTAHVRLIGRD